LCGGVAGCDAHSDVLNCDVVVVCWCVAVVVWWSAMTCLGRPNFTNNALFKLVSVYSVLTPLCMQSMSELCACLFGPCWPRYLPPTACDDKLGSLMIIYSGYPYFQLPLVLLSFGFSLCYLQVTKEEEKRRKER
jgi:hypothetical protein